MPEVTADQYNFETGVFTCAYCHDYQGDKRQVNMHQIHCQKRPQAEVDILNDREEEEEMTDQATPAPPPVRRERIPFGSPQTRLSAPSGDGFHYRFFNDNWAKEPNRIQRALAAGYEIVEGRTPMPVGSNDDGSAIKGVLMRIPLDIYKEDQKLKMKEVDRVDQAIKKGTLEQKAGDNRYIPDGIKVWSSHDENR
jgi:hypothetical protein